MLLNNVVFIIHILFGNKSHFSSLFMFRCVLLVKMTKIGDLIWSHDLIYVMKIVLGMRSSRTRTTASSIIFRFPFFSFPGPQSTILMTFASTLTGTTISSTSLWRFSDARQLRAPKDRPPPPSGALTENVSDALPFLSCSWGWLPCPHSFLSSIKRFKFCSDFRLEQVVTVRFCYPIRHVFLYRLLNLLMQGDKEVHQRWQANIYFKGRCRW